MKKYKVAYFDSDGMEGKTIIESSYPLSKDDAKQALVEQSIENNLNSNIEIHEFQESKGFFGFLGF